jgi:hypothetical protein
LIGMEGLFNCCGGLRVYGMLSEELLLRGFQVHFRLANLAVLLSFKRLDSW